MTAIRKSYDIFAQASEEFKMSPSELGAKLGYSDSAASFWKKKGTIPLVVSFAIEGMRKDTKKPKEKVIFAVFNSEDNFTIINKMLKALDVPFQVFEP